MMNPSFKCSCDIETQKLRCVYKMGKVKLEKPSSLLPPFPSSSIPLSLSPFFSPPPLLCRLPLHINTSLLLPFSPFSILSPFSCQCSIFSLLSLSHYSPLSISLLLHIYPHV